MPSTIKTLNINIWGGPGTGKSIVAAQLFSDLKLSRISCEMVREYAKELTWSGQIHIHEQLEISAEQHRRQASLQGKADIVVTDAPVPQGVLFAPLTYRESLLACVATLTAPWESLNVLLHPNPDVPYEQAGRGESPEMAGMRHEEVSKLTRRLYGESLIEVPMAEAVSLLMPRVLKWHKTHRLA